MYRLSLFIVLVVDWDEELVVVDEEMKMVVAQLAEDAEVWLATDSLTNRHSVPRLTKVHHRLLLKKTLSPL